MENNPSDEINSDEELKIAMSSYLRVENELLAFQAEQNRLAKIIEEYLTKVDDPMLLYEGKAWYLGADGLGIDNYRELKNDR